MGFILDESVSGAIHLKYLSDCFLITDYKLLFPKSEL